MAELDRRLAVVAAAQHSLVRLGDVIEAGGTRKNAADRVAAGRWECVGHEVYRIAGVAWTYEARVLAAVFCAGPGAVASYFCAARLLDLGFPTAKPEVSIPRGRHHRPDRVRVHQSTDLDRADIRYVRGIPVTGPARTLLDLGRYLGVQPLQRAVEAARRQGLTWRELVLCLVAHARKGRHGTRRLRAVIAKGIAVDEVTDTDSELAALSILLESDLPTPTVHHVVRHDDGEILAEIDLAFVPLKLALEIDGTVHLDPEVRAKDEERDHLLRLRGWMVRRVWYEIPLREPERFRRLAARYVKDAMERTEGPSVSS